jgi:hypothetical protein
MGNSASNLESECRAGSGLRGTFVALLVLSVSPLFCQTPRTPDGRPDLQGIWTNITLTPLERPKELAAKPLFTEQEAAEYQERLLHRREQTPAVAGDSVNDPEIWWERGTKLVKTLRTSLIVDPPDGRIPPLTHEAQQRMQAARAYTREHPADVPQDRSLQERCILEPTAGPPMMPGPYNNNYQIVQTPQYVVFFIEMIHDIRIVPLDGSPHLPDDVRLWLGDSRGHWEGDTLVIDTTNFTDKTHYRGSDRNLHVVERFTRTAADTLLYEFTVDDPTAFTKPWKVELPMMQSEGPMYEFACHEGNRAMMNMLNTARIQEKAAAEKAAGQSVTKKPKP